MALGKYLLDNAAFQTGLRLFKHAEERIVRPLAKSSSFSSSGSSSLVLSTSLAQSLIAYYLGILESLVTKVAWNTKKETKRKIGYQAI